MTPIRLTGWGAIAPLLLACGTPYRDGMPVWSEQGERLVGTVAGRPNGKNTVLFRDGVPVATVGFCFRTRKSWRDKPS